MAPRLVLTNQLRYSRMRTIGPQSDLPQSGGTMPVSPWSTPSRFNPAQAIRQGIKNAKMNPAPPLAPAAPVMAENYPITLVGYGAQIITANTLQLAIFQNPLRQRFIIANPILAGETLFFCFKNSPTNLISLIPGEKWDDDSAKVPTDEIWVQAATPGHAYTAYEGVPAPL